MKRLLITITLLPLFYSVGCLEIHTDTVKDRKAWDSTRMEMTNNASSTGLGESLPMQTK